MKNGTLGAVALTAGLLASSASAWEWPWRTSDKPAAAPADSTGVTLGRAVPVTLGTPQPIDEPGEPARVQTAVYLDTTSPAAQSTVQSTVRGVPAETPWVPALGAPQPASSQPTPSQPVFTVASAPPPPPPPVDPYFVPPPPPPGNPIPPPGSRFSGPGLLGCEWLGCTSGKGRSMFQSDHDFDGFISPVSNPFLFEDPRSLTELRPILIYQTTPTNNPAYAGGSIWFLGTQGRLAITDRLSIVMNKLGFVWSDPEANPLNAHPDVGFSELWIGPKLTFWRDDKTCTLAAAGVTFQIPTGNSEVFQDTGHLSVAPYITFAQGFLKDFHFMTTAGWTLSDNSRTQYFYNSYHLDYDVGGLHKIYPLIELNWVYYSNDGGSRPINFEGRDLINFGAEDISGANSLTFAFGARYKFSECLQTGLVMEFPLIHTRDLIDFRITADVIWRY